MPLKRLKNGQYQLSSRKDAIKALEMMDEMSAEVKEAMEEHGINEMMQDAAELKKAATNYMAKNGILNLDLTNRGKVAKFQQAKTPIWIGTKEDIPDNMPSRGIKTLRQIVGKEIWMKLSRRIPDPEKIAEAVAEGIVDEEVISEAMIEREAAPYVRLYDA